MAAIRAARLATLLKGLSAVKRPFRIVGEPLGVTHPRAGVSFTLPQSWGAPPDEAGVRDAVRRHHELLPCVAWTFCTTTGAEGVRVLVYAPHTEGGRCGAPER